MELWRLDLEARIALLERRPGVALRRFEDLEALASSTGSYDGRLRARDALTAASERSLPSR